MKIQVTQVDIDESVRLWKAGSRLDGVTCPVGRALARAFPDVKVSAGFFSVYVEDEKGNTEKKVSLPRSASLWISAVDDDKPGTPGHVPGTPSAHISIRGTENALRNCSDGTMKPFEFELSDDQLLAAGLF